MRERGLTGGTEAVSIVPRIDDLASGDAAQILARLRDPKTASRVAPVTGMSKQAAQSTLAKIQARVEAVRGGPAMAMAEARQVLLELLGLAGTRVAAAAPAAQSYAPRAL